MLPYKCMHVGMHGVSKLKFPLRFVHDIYSEQILMS